MRYFKLLFGFFLLVGLNVFLLKNGVIEYFDYKTYDTISHLTSNNSKTSKSSVVVVDIDEKSLKYLGQWPWSRIILAQLINSIDKTNPSSISLDIIFPEADKTSPSEMVNFYKRYFDKNIEIAGLSEQYFNNDKIFASAIYKTKSILPVYLNNENIKNSKCNISKQFIEIRDSSNMTYESKNILCNIEALQKAAANIGFINATQDIDGVFRRLPLFIKYKDKLIPTLGFATLMSLDKAIVEKNSVSILGHNIKTSENGNVLLNFYNKSWYKTVSAIDVLLGKVNQNILKGKFVFIGTSAIGLHDRYIISSSRSISGVDIHTTLIDNILNDELIYEKANMKNTNMILATLILFILLYYMEQKKQIEMMFIFGFTAVFYIGFSIFMFFNNIYISSAYFLIPLLVGFFIINIILIINNYKEKKLFFEQLSKARSSAIDSMALVVESRDTETGAHIKRTKEYISFLGEYLYKNDIYKKILTRKFRFLVNIASPLHDIGKVAIPDSILKKEGRLTKEEFDIMKNHANIGKDIIKNALKDNKDNEFLQMALNIAYYHHEKWDGTGYPSGLKGNRIPLEARMMALADVYDALISKRVYKESVSFEESEKIIIEGSGTHFDPILVGAFIEIKDKFKDIAMRIKE